MAGLIDRIRNFARSPQGRRVISEGKRAARDPRKRAQLKALLGKMRGKR